MDAGGFYDQPMVRRMAAIFKHPKPPAQVTERQFDGCQEELEAVARTPWHELGDGSPWYYLMDLAYVDLQEDLFDYLFPGYLILWWEGQLSREGGPEGETDFYHALDQGGILEKMLDADRRAAVFEWMVDAYLEGVDAWSGQLDVVYRSHGTADDLHGPLWSLHALGQSVPILPAIWPRLAEVSTAGRAQWWLVLATGLAFKENECPFVPKWTPLGGGGGIYALESAASIYGHGYLAPNQQVVRENLSVRFLGSKVEEAGPHLVHEHEREWASAVLAAIQEEPALLERRIARFVELLGKPDLGGVMKDWTSD